MPMHIAFAVALLSLHCISCVILHHIYHRSCGSGVRTVVHQSDLRGLIHDPCSLHVEALVVIKTRKALLLNIVHVPFPCIYSLHGDHIIAVMIILGPQKMDPVDISDPLIP